VSKNYSLHGNYELTWLSVSTSINASMKLATPRNAYSWYPSQITDPAAFHQLLSNSAVFRRFWTGRSLDSEDSLIHHSKALTLVQSRILDVESSTSDGNLSAIASMCEYSVRVTTVPLRLEERES
jgi:hypothetical protein